MCFCIIYCGKETVKYGGKIVVKYGGKQGSKLRNI